MIWSERQTGLYYYGARYMNPVASIWYGVDPLAEKYVDVSGYTYCLGNPVKLFDPDGEEVIDGVGQTSNATNNTGDNKKLQMLVQELKKHDGRNSIMIVAHGMTDEKGQCYGVNIRSYNAESKSWIDNEITDGKQLDKFLSQHSKVWQSVKNDKTKAEDVHIVFYSCKSAGVMGKFSSDKAFEDVTFIAPYKEVQYNRFKNGWKTSVENTKWEKNKKGNYSPVGNRDYGVWQTFKNGRVPFMPSTYRGDADLRPGTKGFKYRLAWF